MTVVVTRDFSGYGAKPAKVEWPGGALLAVNIAINFEEGAEWCIEYGDPSCEHRGVDPGGATHRPRFGSGGDPSDTRRDLYVEDQYEYGSGGERTRMVPCGPMLAECWPGSEGAGAAYHHGLPGDGRGCWMKFVGRG